MEVEFSMTFFAHATLICVIMIMSAGKNPFDPRGAPDLEWGSGDCRWLFMRPQKGANSGRAAAEPVNVVHVSSFSWKPVIFKSQSEVRERVTCNYVAHSLIVF